VLDDATPSRIPIHRRVTASSRTAGSGSGTTTPTRKLTVPVNGTTPSSRPRTPTGLISPSSGPSSRYSNSHLSVQVEICSQHLLEVKTVFSYMKTILYACSCFNLI
jgi:hypothetical protein